MEDKIKELVRLGDKYNYNNEYFDAMSCYNLALTLEDNNNNKSIIYNKREITYKKIEILNI